METLSVWGEFLGGVGVMLSLIFLGVQTRASNPVSFGGIPAGATSHMARDDVLYRQQYVGVSGAAKQLRCHGARPIKPRLW